MSIQGPYNGNGFDENGVSQGSNRQSPNVVQGYADPYVNGQYEVGYYQVHNNGRSHAPMIDPIESARLTPQTIVLLIISGIKRHWKWTVPMGLILGLIVASILYLAFPLQYEATGLIRVWMVKPTYIFDSTSTGQYSDFVNTQIAIMKSHEVLSAVLQDPAIVKLPVILKQKDQKKWLAQNLDIRLLGRSEILQVNIATDSRESSERIVKSVMDCFFDFVEKTERESLNRMLSDLTQEKNSQSRTAARLQSQIRNDTSMAASEGAVASDEGMATGLGLSESLFRDYRVAQSQLVSMEARYKSIEQSLREPNIAPAHILVAMSPELKQINDEIARLKSANETLNPRNPRYQLNERDIKNYEDRLNAIVNNDDSSLTQTYQNEVRLNAEIDLFAASNDIKAQKVLVDELKRQYDEQLKRSAERSEKVVDVSFNRAQLERTDGALNQIEKRILEVSSETRAPGRIIPLSQPVGSSPSRERQIMVVGTGAAMFAFFPLLLGIVVERMKPRLYHVSQIRRAIPHVLIGEIMEPPISWVRGSTFLKRLARYRESVHNWCTHLLLSDPFRTCQTLSIASVAGDDGKTFLAVQIAVAMAQMKEGKVLLIDGDMRVGRLHLLFGNEETGIGLADVLSGRNKLGEAIIGDEKEPNLFLMSAGQLDVTPYELLGDGRFKEMLDALKQQNPYDTTNFSLVIVVLPPVANAAESLIMASSTDSTLLCVRQGETVLAAMEDVYRKLANTGASVDGIVVKDIPYYQMAGRDGGFADKLEQIRLSHLLQYSE